jgi:hypothetical protein
MRPAGRKLRLRVLYDAVALKPPPERRAADNREGREKGQRHRDFSLHRIAVSARVYRAIEATVPKGSVVYPPPGATTGGNICSG